MSIKIMTQVWATKIGNSTDKLVLLALADNSNDRGECYPSLSTLASKCEIERRSVERVVARLEANGLLTRERRQIGGTYTSTLYRIHLEGRDPKSLGTVSPQGRDHESLSIGTVSPQGRDIGSLHRTIIEPSIEPSLNRQAVRAKARKPKQQTREEPPPSNLNVEAWHRWVQYRQQIRKPLKPASIPAAQRALAAFGSDQEAVVEQSIANGWQGLFELRSGTKVKANTRLAANISAAEEFMRRTEPAQ